MNCTKCNGEEFIKHGTRRYVGEIRQMVQCIKCGRTQKGDVVKMLEA